jgi:hypothetical protein
MRNHYLTRLQRRTVLNVPTVKVQTYFPMLTFLFRENWQQDSLRRILDPAVAATALAVRVDTQSNRTLRLVYA